MKVIYLYIFNYQIIPHTQHDFLPTIFSAYNRISRLDDWTVHLDNKEDTDVRSFQQVFRLPVDFSCRLRRHHYGIRNNTLK